MEWNEFSRHTLHPRSVGNYFLLVVKAIKSKPPLVCCKVLHETMFLVKDLYESRQIMMITKTAISASHLEGLLEKLEFVSHLPDWGITTNAEKHEAFCVFLRI